MARQKTASESAEVLLFTDGACRGNPGPGGWAYILKHPASGNVKKASGGERRTTNNRMELTAAIEGLRAVKNDKPRRVHLVSDSEYVIRGLTQWIHGWIKNDWRRGRKADSPPVLNADLWKTLHALAQKHDMTYEHVRGHAGHPENEECDRMAVQACNRFASHNPHVETTRPSAPPREADAVLYVQGSRRGTDGPGGWGAVVRWPATGQIKRFSGTDSDATSARMELGAIIHGLKQLPQSRDLRVVVVTDDDYILNGINVWMRGWAEKGWRRIKHPDLWRQIHAAARDHELTAEHVRDHPDDPEIRESKRLAAKAARAAGDAPYR